MVTVAQKLTLRQEENTMNPARPTGTPNLASGRCGGTEAKSGQKPYQAPTLRVFGQLGVLTQGVRSGKGDGSSLGKK